MKQNPDSEKAANILVVDDKPENLVALEAILKDFGRVFKANSGKEALRLVLGMEFAVIILDVHMPGMDGLETARLIRQREKSAQTPIIFLTATSKEETDMFRGYEAGAVDFLYKPIVPDILKVKIATLVELHRQSVTVIQQKSRIKLLSEQTNRLFEVSVDILGILSFEGRLLQLNPSWERVLGFAPDKLMAKPLWEFAHSEDRARLRQVLRDLEKTEPHSTIEVRIAARNGDEKWFLCTLTAFPQENILYMVGKDVTERRRTEQCLARITDCLSTLGTDAMENINRLTATCGELLGATCALYNRLERGLLRSVGRWHLPPDFNASDAPEGHICGDVIARAGKETLCIENLPETPYAQSDPNVKRYGLRAYLGQAVFRGEQAIGSLCVAFRQDRKISEADKHVVGILASALGAEEARLGLIENLRESEERFRTVFSNAAIGICLIAPDGRILDANDSLCRTLGYGREELVDKAFHELANPVNAGDCRLCMARLLAGETARAGPCERVLRRDGADVHVEVSCVLLRASTGSPLYFIAEVRDLTAERRAQAEKAFLERQLSQAQKMEAIGRLTGGVAHDFNNLLTAISGFSGFLLESLPQGDPRREDVLEIQRAGAAAAALTRQLLAFSRLRDVAPRVMDLNDAVRDVEKLLRRVIGEDVALETALMAGAAPVLADPNQVHQILLNLAVNARDAMPDGGRMRIGTRPVQLDEAAASARPDARPGPYLALEVSDTGMGMDEPVLSHLFEAFFTTKPEGKGTGLGLSTVYGIVRQCGGFIAVESLPGKGSKFAVHLPLAGLEAAEKKPAAGEGLPQARGEAVLVADDDEFVRRFAVRALKSLGYRVFDSGLPEEALKLGVKEDVQLLLSDLVMPGMTGLELARRLGAEKPRVRALFMSGFSSESRFADGTLADKLLLRKPLSIESLAEAVRLALDSA